MKKMTGLLVLIVVSGLIFTSCESCKKDKATEEVVTEEVVTEIDISAADNVSKALSAALCKRMVECVPNSMTEDECVTQTVTSLVEVQKQKPLDISDDQLNKCISSITSGTCEDVLGTEPPAGCEFLK